ncbi:hypothetical protein [Nostoc sp.]|uniref:hypothetical protein n=1 Tax=Nostoc sp. TaxID=1180 RepID=UPI002FF55F1B
MHKQKDSPSQQLESARSKIINSYLTTIEDSFRENRSQLKLINYGTGSGFKKRVRKAYRKINCSNT